MIDILLDNTFGKYQGFIASLLNTSPKSAAVLIVSTLGLALIGALVYTIVEVFDRIDTFIRFGGR